MLSIYLFFCFKRRGRNANGTSFEDELCEKLWCSQNGVLGFSSAPAAFGTSCGNGKWCENGLCVIASLAPVGKCLLEDKSNFCKNFSNTFGHHNLCLNYENSECCQMCGGKKINKLSDHTIDNWLSNVDLTERFTLLSKPKISECKNQHDWCPIIVDSLNRTIPDLCTNLFLINNELVRVVCKLSCGLC